jgi:hypothetical protein
MPAPSFGLLDGKSVGLLYVIKIYRMMVYMIALFVMEKTYQARFVQDVYVAHGRPPRLAFFPLYVIAIESFFFLLAFIVLLMLERRFKNSDNTFVLDETFLWQAITDYIMTTASILLIGLLLAHVISTCSGGLRYNHDGLRGIRALSHIMQYVIVVIILLPFFLVY